MLVECVFGFAIERASLLHSCSDDQRDWAVTWKVMPAKVHQEKYGKLRMLRVTMGLTGIASPREHVLPGDPCVLTHLAHALEAEILEQFDGATEQESTLGLAACGDLGDGFH